MYNSKLTQGLSVLFFLIFIVAACNFDQYDDLELADNNAEYAFPVLNTSITFRDLMEQTLNPNVDTDTLKIDADGNMTLVYSGDVVEKRALELYDLSQFAGGVPVPINDSLFYVPFDTNSNSALSFLDIKRAYINKGQLTVSGQNNFDQVVTGTLYLPQLRKNGVMFSVDFLAPANGIILPKTVSLIDYELVTNEDSLIFQYEAYLPNGDRVEFSDNRFFALIQNLQFSYMEGFWGQQLYPLTLDTIEIDINETDLQGSNIYVDNPTVTMRVFNSYGFPTRGNIKQLQFEKQDGTYIPMTSPLITNNALDFDYPKLSQNEVGQTKLTQIVFDKSNSNIVDIFNAQPVGLIYEVEGFANATNDPTIVGFITDSSTVRLNVLVEIPLIGRVETFASSSEVDVDFSDLDTGDLEVEEAEFKIIADNGIPVEVKGQFNFLDDQGNTIATLFDEPTVIMGGAKVLNNGLVQENTETVTFATMDGAEFEKIQLSKKMKIDIEFSTTDMGQKSVKLLADQMANLRIGVKVKTK